MSKHSPALCRIISSIQRGRPTPGTGSGSEGRGLTRHLVAAAVGLPKSVASCCRRHRRRMRPRVPVFSAASWKRREMSMGNRTISPTTAPRPPKRKPSSNASQTPFSSSHSTKITRFGSRPACARPGANKSLRVRHHRTCPVVLAAMPAVKNADDAPTTASLPSPPISWIAP